MFEQIDRLGFHSSTHEIGAILTPVAAAPRAESEAVGGPHSVAWGDELTTVGETIVSWANPLPRKPRAKDLVSGPMKAGAYKTPVLGTAVAAVSTGVLLGGIWLVGIGSALRIAGK